MLEYIDRQKTIKIISKYGLANGAALGHHRGVIENAIDDIESIPTEDVAPVRHGRWAYVDVDIVCSVCGADGMLPWDKPFQEKTPYCPHCGAKMDRANTD